MKIIIPITVIIILGLLVWLVINTYVYLIPLIFLIYICEKLIKPKKVIRKKTSFQKDKDILTTLYEKSKRTDN